MRTSWLPKVGTALSVGALACVLGCGGTESLTTSASKNSAASSVGRSLMFEDASLTTSAGPRRWVGSDGVEIESFEAGEREGVQFETSAGGRVRARSSKLPRLGAAREAKVRLAVANASAAHPVEVQFDFYDDEQANRWSKKVIFRDAKWKSVTLRLPKTSYAQGVAASWDRVSSWGMTFASEATVRVQRFELWSDTSTTPPELGLELLAFAAGEPPSLRASRAIALAWMSDEPVVEVDSLFAGFIDLHRTAHRRFPALPDPEQEVPLLAVSTGSAFRSMWNVGAAALGEEKRKSNSSYDWMGFVTAPGSQSLHAAAVEADAAPNSSSTGWARASATVWTAFDQAAASR